MLTTSSKAPRYMARTKYTARRSTAPPAELKLSNARERVLGVWHRLRSIYCNDVGDEATGDEASTHLPLLAEQTYDDDTVRIASSPFKLKEHTDRMENSREGHFGLCRGTMRDGK